MVQFLKTFNDLKPRFHGYTII